MNGDVVLVVLGSLLLILTALVDELVELPDHHRKTDPACRRYRSPRTARQLSRARRMRGRSCPVCARHRAGGSR